MTRFVAEVSSNHARDLARCRRFVEMAARAGCDAVKFQLFRVDRLFAPEVLARSEAVRARRAWELPPGWLPELAALCAEAGVDFWCTPFDLEAVEALRPHVAAYKVASYELLWHELLAACARSGRPVVLSTGMATLPEVEAAVAVLRKHGCAEPTLLHCVSAYPTPPEQANLAAIRTLREATGCPVGWSDHTVDAGVVHRAVHRHGAEVVELHLDLDGAGAEYGAGHCWLPDALARLVAEVRSGERADGDGVKAPAAAEEPDRLWRADPSDGLRPLRVLREGRGAGS